MARLLSCSWPTPAEGGTGQQASKRIWKGWKAGIGQPSIEEDLQGVEKDSKNYGGSGGKCLKLKCLPHFNSVILLLEGAAREGVLAEDIFHDMDVRLGATSRHDARWVRL